MSFLDIIKEFLGLGKKKPEPTPTASAPKPSSKPKAAAKESPAPAKKSSGIDIYSPCDCTLIEQKAIPDEGFSEGHMGTGFGLEPHSGEFKVFMDGQLVVLYKTKHAYFIKDQESGVSVMLHIGINTVEIEEGKQAFTTTRELNDVVKHGDDLCVANLDVIVAEGKSTTTALLIQKDEMEGKKIVYHKKAGERVMPGDLLMSIVEA